MAKKNLKKAELKRTENKEPNLTYNQCYSMLELLMLPGQRKFKKNKDARAIIRLRKILMEILKEGQELIRPYALTEEEQLIQDAQIKVTTVNATEEQKKEAEEIVCKATKEVLNSIQEKRGKEYEIGIMEIEDDSQEIINKLKVSEDIFPEDIFTLDQFQILDPVLK